MNIKKDIKLKKCGEYVPFNENRLQCEKTICHKGDHVVKTYIGWNNPIKMKITWENKIGDLDYEISNKLRNKL